MIFFGSLDICFDAVEVCYLSPRDRIMFDQSSTGKGEPHTYLLRISRTNLCCRDDTRLVFQTHDRENFPLPNPPYLALHAACAKVSHACGAAEYVNKLWWEVEHMPFLAEDGSAAAHLTGILLVLADHVQSDEC